MNKVGDSVEWGNPACPKYGVILKIRRNMPAGRRLGSWTTRFYRDRALVSVNGNSSKYWIVLTRLRRDNREFIKTAIPVKCMISQLGLDKQYE